VKQFAPPWLATLITVLVETGMRGRKEALPLQWSDVSLESEPAYIRIRDSKSAAGVRTAWLTNHCRGCPNKGGDRCWDQTSRLMFFRAREFQQCT
jgi:integrase